MENTTAVRGSRSFSTSTERQNVSPFSLYPSVMGMVSLNRDQTGGSIIVIILTFIYLCVCVSIYVMV